MNIKYILNTLWIIIMSTAFFFIGHNVVHANTSPYRSAGWVSSDGSTQYSVSGCQESNDGLYCSRPSATLNSSLYFGSFGDLHDFGIPLNSKIDKIHLRIKGNGTTTQFINITNAYNKIPWVSSCQTPSDLWSFFLGPIDTIVEKQTLTSGNGLSNCITSNNINFRNLTFRIASSPNPAWSANIDNFEIAFDYTAPSITPTPINYPDNQKGEVWEIGPDKINLSKVGLNNIIAVATGENHYIVLKNDGTVWSWGKNDFGQLGNATTNESSTPVQVVGVNGQGYLTEVKSIEAGSQYSLALKKDGTVWTWGNNSGKFRGLGNDADDKLLFPRQITSVNFNKVKEIAAGKSHSLALNTDGTVVGWGLNNNGQLGIGCFLFNCSSSIRPARTQNIDNVKTIVAGDSHSFAIKSDGTVWGWGNSRNWRLGETVLNMNNTFPERSLPVQIPELINLKAISVKSSHNIAVTNEGTVLEWGGEDRLKSPKQIAGISTVSKISSGTQSFSPGVTGHAIKDDGTLWQLYINDIPAKKVDVLSSVVEVASGDHTSAVAIVGNANGEVLGDSTTPTPTQTPTPSISPTPAPFLDLPWDYQSKGHSFEQVALNPNSWFDHKYPLQNVFCCTFKVLLYTGKEVDDAYRSHSGYDYSSINGVVMHTPVIAAASGTATFIPESKSGGAGHMIKINHTNGYQTWYEHLHWDEIKTDHGLIVDKEGVAVEVAKGQEIGKVGMSGNTNGPHIHFSVFKDENNNGTFADDYPYGLVDPLGWEGEQKDPWTDFANSDETKYGAESYNLFLARAAPKVAIISQSGGSLTSDKITIDVPTGSSPVAFTLTFTDGPSESSSATLKSAAPSFFLTAINSIGAKITQFLNPITITYSYKDANLLNIKEDTLKLYHYNEETNKWDLLPSTLNKTNKTVTALTTGFSQFALMGEIKDSEPPITNHNITGDKGKDNWYNSDVIISLNTSENIDGLGIEYILYKLDNTVWKEYQDPIVIENSGEHILEYKTIDKAYNIEAEKSVSFSIDKTAPISAASISGTQGEDGWFVSDVTVSLSATDNGELDNIEYSLDGGESFVDYGGSFTVSDEGSKEVLYRAVDKAGNVELSNTLSLKIDKTAPSSLVYTTGSLGENGWYTSDVEVGLNALDSGSGFDEIFYSYDGSSFEEYITPLTFITEGSNRLYYYSVDKAGNTEETKEFVIKLDKSAPEIEVIYDIHALDIRINGKDNLSTSLSTSALFTNTTGEVTVEDQAGNILKVIVKDKEKGKNARLSIVSLQYNSGEIIQVAKNTLSVKYDYFDVTTNTIKKFDQDWKVNDISKLTLSYSTDTDNTSVKNRLFDGTVDATIVLGKKFLKVSSYQGLLTSSY